MLELIADILMCLYFSGAESIGEGSCDIIWA